MILSFILQMKKLRYRGVSNSPNIIQLANCKTGIQTLEVRIRSLFTALQLPVNAL